MSFNPKFIERIKLAKMQDLTAGQEKRIAAVKASQKGGKSAYKSELKKVQTKETAKGAEIDSTKVAALVSELKKEAAGKGGMAPGGGGRFTKLEKKIKQGGERKGRKNIKDPEAVAAAIGRKKYGKEKFQRMAAQGKKD